MKKTEKQEHWDGYLIESHKCKIVANKQLLPLLDQIREDLVGELKNIALAHLREDKYVGRKVEQICKRLDDIHKASIFSGMRAKPEDQWSIDYDECEEKYARLNDELARK
jgi:uncharacterized protein YktB (UPF0637 family)